MRVGILAALTGALFCFGIESSLAGPSFDCQKASNANEFSICADPFLSQLDFDMSALFSRIRNGLEEDRAQILIKSQRSWLKQRATCNGDGECLGRLMRSRIEELTGFGGSEPVVALSCPEAIADAKALSAGATFTIDAPATLFPSSELRLNYTLPSARRSALPLYIVFDLPAETRFRGKGFLPLTAGARGPHGLKHAGERTRAIIPLDRGQPSTTGTVSAFLLLAGTHTIGFSIVTGGDCGEHVVLTHSAGPVKIELGLPEIVIQDAFANDAADAIVNDASGRYTMQVYDGRYIVLDQRTGALLLSRAGREPRFSPTGRFVATVRPTDNRIEVIDLSSGTVTNEFRPGVLAWARDDSFIVHGATIRQLDNTIVSSINPDIVTGTSMPNMGVAWREVEIVLDIDNMFAAMTADNVEGFEGGALFWDIVSGAHSVQTESRAVYQPSSGSAGELLPGPRNLALRQLVKAQRGIDVPLEYPLWKFGEPVQVTHVDYGYNFDPGRNTLQSFVHLGQEPADRPKDSREPETASSCRAAELQRGLARFQGNIICATEVSGRGLGRLPRAVAQTPEETIFERIAGVIGAVKSAEPVRVENLGDHADISDERKERIRLVTETLSQLTADVSAGISPLPQEEAGFNCHTAPEKFDPQSIETVWHWTEGQTGAAAAFLNCYAGSSRISAATLFLISQHGIRDISPQLLPDDAPEDGSAFGWSSSDTSALHIFPLGPDRILVTASYSGTAAIIDIPSGKRAGNLFPLANPTLIRAMRLSGDGRHLIQLNHDGRFIVFRTGDGEHLLSGASIDDEIVVMLPDGRFDTTYEGAHALNIRFAGQTSLQTVHQFGAALYRPGLARDVLEGRDVAGRPETIGSPPLVDLVASDAVDGRRRLLISASDETMLNSLRVFVDGRLKEERFVEGTSTETEIDIIDPGGGHWITVVAADHDGLVSVPKAVLLPPPKKAAGALRAVVVGIDSYTIDPAIPPLRFARSDAERLSTVLRNHETKGASAEVNLLTDGSADRDAILAAVKAAVASTGPDDTLVFSFAGHGVGSGSEGKTGELLLALPSTRADALLETALPWRDIANELSRSKGTVVVLLDACHTGLAGSSSFATNDDAAGALLTSSGAPMVVLAASKGRQVALEKGESGGGLFTTAIVEALSTRRGQADADANGVIDLGEFYTSVKSRVVDETDGAQSPWLARNLLVGDMALF